MLGIAKKIELPFATMKKRLCDDYELYNWLFMHDSRQKMAKTTCRKLSQSLYKHYCAFLIY